MPTTDARCALPHARALGVLLRSIIVEREPIYRQAEMVQGFAGWLFGLEAHELEHLSDDRIGRALDRLFDADRAALLTDVVVAVGQRFGVRFQEFHNDSTSIRFCGQYGAASRRTIRGRTAPAITYGYSKDHRPDLKQLLFQKQGKSNTARQQPVRLERSGNAMNDRVSFVGHHECAVGHTARLRFRGEARALERCAP